MKIIYIKRGGGMIMVGQSGCCKECYTGYWYCSTAMLMAQILSPAGVGGWVGKYDREYRMALERSAG